MSSSWLRTSWLLPWVVWKTGMRTPSRITVTTVVTIAAMLGAALRRSALKASWMKNQNLDIRAHQSIRSSPWPLV